MKRLRFLGSRRRGQGAGKRGRKEGKEREDGSAKTEYEAKK